MLPETDNQVTSSQSNNPVVFVTGTRAEKYLIDKARQNPADFIFYLTERKLAKHHLKWLLAFLDPRISHTNIVAPRESAKTTISVYYLAWLIGKKPHLTHFIGSVSSKQSTDRLQMVKEIMQMPRFVNVFPWIHVDLKRSETMKEFSVWSEKWANGDSRLDYSQYRSLVARFGSLSNPTVFAAGIGSSEIIGRRFSGMVLLDDPHDEQNSSTEDQRIKVEDFLNRTLLPCRQDGSKAVVISTRWAVTDLSGRLKNKPTIWFTIDTPAINSDGSSYWPEYWSIEKLDKKREEIGEVMFQTMYMNNPNALASNMFKIDFLRTPLPNSVTLQDSIKKIVVSVDLAVTTKAVSDYTVCAAVAIDDSKPYSVYVLDLLRGKYDFNSALREINRFSRHIFQAYGKLDGILFEQQGFQRAWAEELRERFPDLPVKLVPTKGDKTARLGALAVKAQRGLLYINTSMFSYPAMCSELISFPRASHDDIADALSLPFQYWGETEMASGIILMQSPYLL